MDKQRVPSPWGTTFCDSISFSTPGRWIYISGQIGALENGELVNETFAAEADQCFERIRLSVEKAAATMSDIVKITGFVTSTDHYPDYDAARGRAFAGNPPSSATVQVAGLVNDARVEIEAVAFVPVE
ncbi:MAG: RidA family protein [Solirubrobacteraceae bacterium]